jgi:branched-chain amino acid transport system permease protein
VQAVEKLLLNTPHCRDKRELAWLPAFGLENASLSLGPFSIGALPLPTLGAAVLVIFVLNRLLYSTLIGRAFRAVSDDSTTAQLMGVSNGTIFAVAMGLALALCTVAALFLGAQANFDPTIGPGSPGSSIGY